MPLLSCDLKSRGHNPPLTFKLFIKNHEVSHQAILLLPESLLLVSNNLTTIVNCTIGFSIWDLIKGAAKYCTWDSKVLGDRCHNNNMSITWILLDLLGSAVLSPKSLLETSFHHGLGRVGGKQIRLSLKCVKYNVDFVGETGKRDPKLSVRGNAIHNISYNKTS